MHHLMKAIKVVSYSKSLLAKQGKKKKKKNRRKIKQKASHIIISFTSTVQKMQVQIQKP